MSDSGLLIVLSGFSGSGKGTIMKELLRRFPDNYALSISATTRMPRAGEKNGREYFFKSKEEFSSMVEKNELLEYAQYVDNFYGTPRAYVEKQLSEKKNVLLEIEIQGGLKIKEQFPQALLLFVMPPTVQKLVQRLSGRGTESKEVIQSRLCRAVEEAKGCHVYDYLIINDELGACVRQIHQIIGGEHCRMNRNLGKMEAIKKELKCYAKGE